MSGAVAFPRRRPAPHQPAARPRTASAPPLRESVGGQATCEALDVARYVADMALQLETMCAAVDLDLLSYFLSMARVEAELCVSAAAAVPEEEARPGRLTRRAGSPG
jgi:hypothetical protein